jgi:hypothetical protein
MNKPATWLLALSVLPSLAAIGCHEDPPTPTEVRGKISTDFGNVLREGNDALTNSTDGLPGLSAIPTINNALGTDTALGLRVRAMTAQLVAQGVGATPSGTPMIDPDAEVAYLNDKLFTDANHVGDGIYQVPASLVCTKTTVDPTGTTTETIDAMCADALAKADLRIRTAKDGDALEFALQLDADHDEPLILRLTHTSIALTVNLDDTQHAFVALATLFGSNLPNAALSGQVTGTLTILGPQKAQAKLTIDRALSIKFAKAGVDLASSDAFLLSSAKAEVFSVTLDGAAKTGSLAVGLGETAVKIPGSTPGKRYELDLPGATMAASFTAGQVQLTHLGLGNRSTTVSINGATARTIDLNASDGRAVDATVSHDPATGTDTVTVTPRLDLQMTADHAVLGDQPPVYDVTRVLLDGSLRGSDASAQTQVLTGSFSITTNPASHGFTATAGQCVTSSDATDPSTGELFTQWAVGACR